MDDDSTEATAGQEQEAQLTAEQERELITAAFEGRTAETPPEPEAKDEKLAPAPAPAPPEFVQITQKDLDELRSSAAEVAALKAAQEKLARDTSGRFGGMQQRLDARQTMKLPAKEKLEAIRRDWPEVAEALDSIEIAQAAPAFDHERAARDTQERLKPELERVKQEALTTARNELRSELLAEQHPDWQEVASGDEFTAYVKTQGAEFTQKLAQASEAWDHRFIGRALASFKATKTKAADDANDRRSDLAAAVNPRGTAKPAQPGKTEAELIMAGFNRSKNGH